MALSSDSKLKVLYHLCYPATSLTAGNTNFNSVIRDRLSIEDQAICDQIDKTIEELDEAESCIREAKKCLKVESVDGIKMNKDHIRNSIAEYRRLIKKLSCSIDIPSKGNCISIGVRV